jgi:preprotein translocase subunit SecD
VTHDRAESMLGDIRAAFHRARIPLTDLNMKGDTVSVRVTDSGRIEEARKIITDLNPLMGNSMLGTSGRNYDISEPGNGAFVLRMTEPFKALTRQQVMSQSSVQAKTAFWCRCPVCRIPPSSRKFSARPPR